MKRLFLASALLAASQLPATAQIIDQAIGTTPGGSNGQLQYNNSGAFGGSPASWNASQTSFGLATGAGSAFPASQASGIELSANPTAPPAAHGWGPASIHVTGGDPGSGQANQPHVTIDTFGNFGIFGCRRSDGTNAAPTQVLANEEMCDFAVYSRDDAGVTNGVAGIVFSSVNTHTTTDHSTVMHFVTVSPGSVLKNQNAMVLGSGLGLNTTTDPGLGNLLAAGGSIQSGVAGSQQGCFVMAGATSGTQSICPPAAASGVLTAPAVTDTLVTRNTAETLASKTLSSPTLSGTVTGPDAGTWTSSGISLASASLLSAGQLKAAGTAGAGFLELVNQSSAPGTPSGASRLFIDSSNRLSWKGTNGFVRTFDGTANTADRVYILPDVSDTFAMLGASQTFTGVNTFSNASTPIAVFTRGGTAPTASPGVAVQIVGTNTGSSNLELDAFGGSFGNLVFRNAGTSSTSPSAVAASTVTGQINFHGYDGSAYRNSAIIRATTIDAFDSTHRGTYLSLFTNPSGSTTVTEALRLQGSGGLSIGSANAGTDVGNGGILGTDLYSNDASFLIRTKTALNNGAAAQTGTLANAPAAGNPTKWIPIDDNGTTRYIPAW